MANPGENADDVTKALAHLGPVYVGEKGAREAAEEIVGSRSMLGKRLAGAFVHVQDQNPVPLAHEVGHAQIDKYRLGRALQSRGLQTAGAALTKASPYAAGVAGAASDNPLVLGAAALSGGLGAELRWRTRELPTSMRW